MRPFPTWASRWPCSNLDRRPCITGGQPRTACLAGECLADRGGGAAAEAWDFVHCPPDTEHGFVGAGDGPCVILMTGARRAGRTRAVSHARSWPSAKRGSRDRDHVTGRAYALPEVATRPPMTGRIALGQLASEVAHDVRRRVVGLGGEPA